MVPIGYVQCSQAIPYPYVFAHGSAVAYTLYGSFNTTVRAAHFVFLPFFPPSAQEIAQNNITLSDIQNVTEQRNIEWNTDGTGYFVEQSTKVRLSAPVL
jgi:hypothetical protein